MGNDILIESDGSKMSSGKNLISDLLFQIIDYL